MALVKTSSIWVVLFPERAELYSLFFSFFPKILFKTSRCCFFTTLRWSYLSFSYRKEIYMLKKSILAILSVLVLSSALTACNTTRGVGEDVSAGGQAIQKSAQ